MCTNSDWTALLKNICALLQVRKIFEVRISKGLQKELKNSNLDIVKKEVFQLESQERGVAMESTLKRKKKKIMTNDDVPGIIMFRDSILNSSNNKHKTQVNFYIVLTAILCLIHSVLLGFWSRKQIKSTSLFHGSQFDERK